MRSIIICLLTTALCLPCLAQGNSANNQDCTTLNIRETSFPFHATSTCVGDEDILLTITSHRTIRQCRDEDGNITIRTHTNFHGTAVGTVSGNEYVLNAQQKSLTVASPGCESNVTTATRELLVSKGPLPDRETIITSNITTDSNCDSSGTFTFDIICK